MKPIALAAVAVVLALPGAAAGERSAGAASAKAPPRTVLALEGRRNHSVVVRLDGPTLRPLRGRRVALDGHAGAWAYSPDRRKIAFGVGEALGLNLVDTRRMRRAGRVTLANGEVAALAWPTANRIVGVEEVAGLFVVDPNRRRLLHSERLDGWLQGFDRFGTSLVLLIAPEGAIGAPRLIAVDPNGATRSVTLDRLRAGTDVTHDEPPPAGHGESRRAGLAVDAAGSRAFVVGAAGDPIAEIDLATLTVSYRVPSARRSFLARLRNWLEPAAAAKVPLAGSSRHAAWLGGGLLAYSGVETAVTGESATMTPAGLSIVDTRDWSIETVDARANGFVDVAGMLLTTGERTGLVGYTTEGVRRYDLFAGRDVTVWDVLASRVFAKPHNGRIHIVEASTGKVVGTRSTMRRLLHGEFARW
jgi:hypothetical protein